jgi:hypothetical protein
MSDYSHLQASLYSSVSILLQNMSSKHFDLKRYFGTEDCSGLAARVQFFFLFYEEKPTNYFRFGLLLNNANSL